MRENKNVIYQEITTDVDPETGEVSRQSHFSKAIVEREPAFVKMYVADIVRFKDLPKSTNDVLMCFLRSMSYRNVILAYAPVKRIMAKELGMKMATLNKAIDNLYKKGVFLRIERGVYVVDPQLFGKGEWKDIKKLRLVIEYNEDGTKQISGGREKLEQLELF